MTKRENETLPIQNQKAIARDQARKRVESLAAEHRGETFHGKAAEKLRRHEIYRQAETLMISPGSGFRQFRINALADRKNLLIPTPNLEKGFLFVDPAGVPVSKRAQAVRGRHNPWGFLVKHDRTPPKAVDLIVGGALAAGLDGGVVGSGEGHLDLQTAVMREMGWLAGDAAIFVMAADEAVRDQAPSTEADVRAHWIVTASAVMQTQWRTPGAPRLHWELLDEKRIRRSDLLHALYRRRDDR